MNTSVSRLRGSGARAIVETLLKKDIQTIFGLPGAHILSIYDALYDVPEMRRIIVRHEQGAAFMALGYSWASGRTSACLLSPGPGATNALSGVAEAYRSSIPVLVISGQISTRARGKEAIHDIDLMSIYKTVTKWQGEAGSVEEIPDLLSRALSVSIEGRPRPVYVQIPQDVLRAEGDFDVHEQVTNVKSSIPSEPIERTVHLILEAERPIIIAGGGVTASEAWQELHQLVELLQIPIATSFMGRGVIPEDHPLCVGSMVCPPAFTLIAEADCVLALGCRFSETATCGWRLRVSKRLIHVDIDPNVLGMIYPAELDIVADTGDFLKALLRTLKKTGEKPPTKAWLGHVAEMKRELTVRYAARQSSPNVPLSPYRAMREIAEALPSNAIVLSDSGANVWWTQLFLKIYRPRSIISPIGNWSMAFGLLTGIGAKCAKPDSPVVSIVGDGGFMMSCQDLLTAVEYKIPVVVAIFNDGVHSAIRAYQKYTYGGRYIDSAPMTPNFVELAKSMGAEGTLVERPGEVGEALKTAMESDKPYVLDIQIDPNEELPDCVRPLYSTSLRRAIF